MDVAIETLLDHALRYAGRGIPVFPLKPRGKLPLTVKGFKDATTDAGQIRAWWNRWPDANIGIPTGVTFDVVDIDARHGGTESLERLQAAYGPVPETPLSMTGGGGLHYCFLPSADFRNSAGQLGAGIDTRGTGGYIVAPPSVHESGKTYEWEGSADLFEIELAPLPDWLHPRKARPAAPLAAGNLGEVFAPAPPKADGSPVREGGRNNAAASLAGQYIQKGTPLFEVMRILSQWNQDNDPPLPDDELKRTVASVARTHAENHPGTPVPIAAVESEPCAPDASLFVPAKPFPSRLLEPPGLVGDICRWVNSTAYKPQPVFALANAIAFCGALFGRKVRTGKLRSNLYVLGVGASCSGKEHSRKQIKNLCGAAGLTQYLLGGEDVSSDSAILQAVHEHPSILFQWDEIGHMFAATNNRNAQSHQRAIGPLLTKLFTSANTTFLGKEYANRKDNARKDIVQPNVCLYGTAEPQQLLDGLTPAEITNGFFGRMIVLQIDNPDTPEQDGRDEEESVPDELVETVQRWWTRDDMPKASGNIAATLHPMQHVVQKDETAERVFRDFRDRCRGYRAEQRESGGLDALWGRAMEHAAKVALVIACGESFDRPVIRESSARFGVELVEHATQRLVEAVGYGVAGNEQERTVLKLLNLIRHAGAKGIDRSQLVRRSRWVNSRERATILDQLVESKEVKIVSHKPARGAEAMVYVATPQQAPARPPEGK